LLVHNGGCGAWILCSIVHWQQILSYASIMTCPGIPEPNNPNLPNYGLQANIQIGGSHLVDVKSGSWYKNQDGVLQITFPSTWAGHPVSGSCESSLNTSWRGSSFCVLALIASNRSLCCLHVPNQSKWQD
jgi:hypothetical protein